jgi:hypothetical protein
MGIYWQGSGEVEWKRLDHVREASLTFTDPFTGEEVIKHWESEESAAQRDEIARKLIEEALAPES